VLRWLAGEWAVFGPHMLGYALSGWALFATLAWAPALLARAFGYGAGQAGAGAGHQRDCGRRRGALFSGWLLDRLARAGRADTTFLVGIAGGLGCALSCAGLALAQGRGAAVAALAGLHSSRPFPSRLPAR
jgi:hypothetical protein